MVISTLLDVARDAATTRREQTSRIADIVPGLKAAVGPGVAIIDLTSSSTARVAAPKDLVVRAVSPVIDNAARHALSEVVIEAVESADRVDLVVRDDGAGIDPSVRDRLFEPGCPAAGAVGWGSASPVGWRGPSG